MSFQTIVYGRIISGQLISENKTVIQNLETEQAFPWILKEMFSFQELNTPYYFENQIITFGATYKQAEDDLTCWLIKFENILNKLDFVTAKIVFETEIFGTYHFFWLSKSHALHNDDEYKKMGLNISKNWFYGYGIRSVWGTLENIEIENQMKDLHNLRHPFELTDEDNFLLENLLKNLNDDITYFYDLPEEITKNQNKYFPLLTKLETENKIIFKSKNSYQLGKADKFGPYIKKSHSF